MIAITGASGHLGKATLEFLLMKTTPESIVAIVRDPQKITEFADKGVIVRQGDYEDQASYVASLTGVDTLLLISSAVLGDERVNQHSNVINAAKEVGVKHIFYTSAPNPSLESSFSPAIDHFRTETLLKDSGLAYTIFRNNLYMDVLPMVLGDAVQSGKLYYPAGDSKVSFALRNDMAEALANALTSEGHENQVYDIGANTAWSFGDIASYLSQNGKTVDYIDILGRDYEAELGKHLPPVVAKIFAGMAEGIKKSDFNVPSSSLTELLGREPVSLDAYLKSIA
ncbi:NAD(P)H-binding protein [Spirosoma sp. HMF4905]|uniref:NAD(P)H-binding protein n=1 Tax=Spirosoma arboris TaxID=2682092 RepID=A0A7K1SPT0_9BACT|nr:SDR family oxidoreductase [Spirosoma arboris]MVM35596.1 NAD(P)H-binding protein [Spirosoma arboris]